MSEKKTHWKATMHPDYLGAWALQPGEEPILTIQSVSTEKVVGTDGQKEECTVMRYKGIGPGKMILNATNCKTIEKVTGSQFIEDWPGHKVQVYAEKVKAFGSVVDAIRIRPFKPKAAAPVPKCTDCGGEIKAAFGKTAEGLAQYTTERFGAPKCAACAQKRAAEDQPTEGGSAE